MKIALALTALLAVTSCGVNEYCLNCATEDGGGNGDGGGPDAITDGGAMPDTCVPTGLEVCNGLDDDCDGTPDDNVVTVGDPCGVAVGECTEGVIECNGVDGLECSGVAATAEACDTLDNDCDGTSDEGNPEGGQMCGTDIGECVGGFTTCLPDGTLDCAGDMGTVGGDPEECDGRDNDCDGNFDEGLPSLGVCGATDLGECEFGTFECVGGGAVCLDAIGPTFEDCDALDTDCDGDPTNGYDLSHDVRNCGACDTSCIGTVPNATAACSPACNGGANDGDACDAAGDCPGGTCPIPVCVGGANAGLACDSLVDCPGGSCPVTGECVVGNCDPGFYDIQPTGPAPDFFFAGCEYGCDFLGTQEGCNDNDDDCDGDIDENLMPPPICNTTGACAGTVAMCLTTGTPPMDVTAFDCVYSGDVSVDGMGNLVQEQQCDGIDNDCDNRIDEGDPAAFNRASCDDGLNGVCRSFGHMVCDPMDQNGPPICSLDLAVPIIDTPGQPSSAEVCDAKDNNCNGFVDDGIAGLTTPASRAALQPWMSIGGGREIMKYEASRPDAFDPNPGALPPLTSNITAISRNSFSATVSVTTSTAHNLSIGENVTIAGVTDATFNGDFTVVTSPTTTTFTYGQAGATVASSGGTATGQLPSGFPLGVVSTYACSRAGVQPWTNIRHDEAETACQAVGGRLCTEQEWHRACSAVAGTAFPVAEPAIVANTAISRMTNVVTVTTGVVAHNLVVGQSVIIAGVTPAAFNGTFVVTSTATTTTFTYAQVAANAVGTVFGTSNGNGQMFFEAEDYQNLATGTFGGVVRTWVPDYTGNATIGQYSGISAMRASPNSGADLTAAQALAGQGARLEYTITLTAAQNVDHYVWVRVYAPNTNDNAIFVSISGSATGLLATSTTPAATWTYRRAGPFTAPGVGTRTVTIYMDKDGVKVDALIVTRSSSATAPTGAPAVPNNAGDWSFSTSPDVYVADSCNGEDNDGDVPPATGGDQDDVIATGSKAMCFANGAGTNDVFDMSGNVKEWTSERLPNTNPLRGGASNNEALGIACGLAFTVADDNFFFTNLGFRCCR